MTTSNGLTEAAGAVISDWVRYGIDIRSAGTLQERYFMILAGLLEKNLKASVEIRDLNIEIRDTNLKLIDTLTQLNRNTTTRDSVRMDTAPVHQQVKKGGR